MKGVWKAFARARRRFEARPLDTLLAIVAVGITGYVIVAPLRVVRYPPITDLPMHAAITSAFRHWFDPTWHFQDQFELQPLRVPVLTHYVLGALLALVLPIGWAVKLSTGALLALLPAGLAVYCRGLKKSPLFGIGAAGLVWGTMTQWGFINFVGALGLTLMGLGFTFMVIERPSRARAAALGVVSLLLFFTHVSRFPVYCAAVSIASASMLPLSPARLKAARAAGLALAPSLFLFAVWWFLRPASLSVPFRLGLDFGRARKIGDYLMHGFEGTAERSILLWMGVIVLAVGAYSLVVAVVLARRRGRQLRPTRRAIHAFGASAAITLMFVFFYFTMPMKIGEWSWVFPREITAAVLASLVLLPSLPRDPWLRAPAVAALLVAVVLPMQFVKKEYAAFQRATRDFQAIVTELPRAPKLGYIVGDLSGSDALAKPFVHLPAWVQAERGGWLSFHFAAWNATPIRFRTTEPKDVPPETPDQFEWKPELFDVATRGKYFEWFLVRAARSPSERFAVDPTIHLEDHRGTWWLYKRD